MKNIKKILIVAIVVIIIGIIGIIGYWLYSNFNLNKNNTVTNKIITNDNAKQENTDKITTDELLKQQQEEIEADNEKIKTINRDTDFDPKTASPQEVNEKLDKFIKEIEKTN